MNETVDPSTMNSAQLGAAASSAFNDPALSSAQGAVNTAQGEYTQQLNDNGTLPQMLSDSLNGSLSNTQDPQRTTDLATLLTGLNNPSSAINDAETMQLPQDELNKQPGVVNASGQSALMAGKLGLAAARLSTDNNLLSARGMGITGLLGVFSNYMANHTQALLASVQNAQNNRDYLFQKAQTLGNMALNLSQLKQNAEQFGVTAGQAQQGLDMQKGELTGNYNGSPTIGAQQLALDKAREPLIQATAAQQKLAGEARGYSDFDSFYGAAKSNPALSGLSDQAIYNLYTSNGGTGQMSANLQKRTGIRTGNRWQDFTNTGSVSGPVGAAAQGVEGAVSTAAGMLPSILPFLLSVL